MTARPITLVRIYLREGEHLHDKLVRFLSEEQRVSGLTVWRGILGQGEDGRVHPASLLDLSLDLPLTIEFFETPEQAEQVVAALLARFDLPHVIAIPATAYAR